MKSQKQLVLEYLLKGRSITQREAIAYWNIIRLGAIIYSLKKEGYKFITLQKLNYNGKGKYASYRLVKKEIEIDF